MNQHILSRFAIFLLAIVLIVFGIEHFVHPRNMFNYVPNWIPGGLIWVYIVGAACILVAVSFMLNQMVKVTAYLLALLLFSFVFCVHLPNYLNTAESGKSATRIFKYFERYRTGGICAVYSEQCKASKNLRRNGDRGRGKKI